MATAVPATTLVLPKALPFECGASRSIVVPPSSTPGFTLSSASVERRSYISFRTRDAS